VGREVDNQVAAPTEREHPPCTERQSLTKECEWKDGDRGGLAEGKNSYNGKTKSFLTLTGLLMEGLWTTDLFFTSSAGSGNFRRKGCDIIHGNFR
jgi:hypothetical protein